MITVGSVTFALLVCLSDGPLQIAAAQLTPNGVDVFTNRYDIGRTGANPSETVLTTKTVSGEHFGKVFEREVDGGIFAQPLIKTGVVLPGVGVGGRNYAESLMQLYPGELMSTKQVFTPSNHEYLNDRDLDFSMAPVLDNCGSAHF